MRPLEDALRGGLWGEAIQNSWMESWSEGGQIAPFRGQGWALCSVEGHQCAEWLRIRWGRDSAEQLHVAVPRLCSLLRQLQQETAGPRCPGTVVREGLPL